MAVVIARRFAASEPPLTERDIIVGYHLPSRLVGTAVNTLVTAGLISRVVIDGKKEIYGLQPSIDIDKITVSLVRDRLEALGRHGFIPSFDTMFSGVAGDVRLVDLEIDDLRCVNGKYGLRHTSDSNDSLTNF